jgi:hypothetical protein
MTKDESRPSRCLDKGSVDVIDDDDILERNLGVSHPTCLSDVLAVLAPSAQSKRRPKKILLKVVG